MHVKTQELVEGKNQLLEDNRRLSDKLDELQLKLNSECLRKPMMVLN